MLTEIGVNGMSSVLLKSTLSLLPLLSLKYTESVKSRAGKELFVETLMQRFLFIDGDYHDLRPQIMPGEKI